MKVMISLPMNGVSDEEVKKTMDELRQKAEKLGIEIVDSFDTTEVQNSKHPGVYYLGRTLMNHLHDVDAVYFVGKWIEARGCRIEFAVCQEYGIKILPEGFFDTPVQIPIIGQPTPRPQFRPDAKVVPLDNFKKPIPPEERDTIK